MTKLTLSCDVASCDNIIFEEFEGRMHVEVIMDIESDHPVLVLSKQDVAKLVEFLNELELEE